MNGDLSLAVHALVFLDHKNCTQSSEQLAQNICTHPVRVRRVLAKLARAGLVRTREGGAGGSLLVRPAADITLCQVAAALSVRFVEVSWRSGDVDMDCLVASGMRAVMDGIYRELDELCQKRLQSIAIGDLTAQIFGGPAA